MAATLLSRYFWKLKEMRNITLRSLLLVAIATLAAALHAQSDAPSTATLVQGATKFNPDVYTSRTLTIASVEQVRQQAQTGFFLLESLERSLYRTEVSGWYDDKAVWFNIRAHGKTLPQLKRDFSGRDSDVWQDDSVEVFLAPTENINSYWHLIVNPAGGILDEFRAPGKGAVDRKHNLENLRASILYDYEWWQVDIAIPFESLGVETPKPGDSMRVNFTRFVPVLNGEDEWSTWTPIPVPTFHAPKEFGKLVFEENDTVIRFEPIN